MLKKKKHPALTKSRVYLPSMCVFFFTAVCSWKLCKNDPKSNEKDFRAKRQMAINAINTQALTTSGTRIARYTSPDSRSWRKTWERGYGNR